MKNPPMIGSAIGARAGTGHCLSAFRTKGALVAADVGFIDRRERFLASFAFVTNFQGHTFVH
jgi:hypothetical protein